MNKRFAIISVTILLTILVTAKLSFANYAQFDGQQNIPANIPANIEYIKDVDYGKVGPRLLKLNILRLKKSDSRPKPSIVFVHGGAWLGGNKEDVYPVLIDLAKRGYFIVSIDYRLSQEAPFPAQLEDCKCSVRWLRAHADEYNISPDRIGIIGCSAGGHLAALTGTSGGIKGLEGKGGWRKYSSSVQAVVDIYGVTDFLQLSRQLEALGYSHRVGSASPDKPDSPESHLIGGPLLKNRDASRKASPITYVTYDDPAFLIIHGDRDQTIPIAQSETFYNELKKSGVMVQFEVIRGAGHGFRGADLHMVNNMIIKFFDENLKR